MAPPHETTDGLPSSAPAVPSKEDKGGSSHSPTGDTVKDQVVAVNQELEKTPDNSNDDQSVGQDNKADDKEANEAHEQPTTSAPPLLFEIRALQERLSQLEQQASHQPKIDGPDLTNDADADEEVEGEEEKRLRKHIRRARWAKKSVKMAEEKAQETEKDRAEYAYTGPYLRGEPTSYQVEKIDKDVGDDFASRREFQLWIYDEDLSSKPVRAIRPLTSLRPTYSRKLGPPTQWDTSDSEEWSDGSTRSRDFDYFRARLRGDFEWELDRLSAQRARYLQHKEKKKTKEEREKQEQEDKLIEEKLAKASALEIGRAHV